MNTAPAGTAPGALPGDGAETVDGPGGRREAPDGFVAAAPSGRAAGSESPASTEDTLSKNSAAIRFDTPTSIRCPTPPIIPPTVASAS